MTTTLEYDALGRIAHRASAQGSSDYVYVGQSDWLLKETWHSSLSGNTFDLVQYDYVNGAPFRMQVASTNGNLSQLNGYSTYYLQMNWHGDAMILVGTQGNAGNNYNINYDPWGGNASPHASPRNYYGWNAAWGYQYFADLQMYYVHGRWWRSDIAIFLSPSEEGEYRYGSGQDAINDAWIVDTLIAFGQQGDWQRSLVLGTGAYMQDSVTATHYVFYPPDDWTLDDRFRNARRVYEPVLTAQCIVVVGPQVIVRGVPYVGRGLLSRFGGGAVAACLADTNDCTQTVSNASQSVWRIHPWARGTQIERILGGRYGCCKVT